MTTLPVMPADMPVVLIRPRSSARQLDRVARKPFAVDVNQLRDALEWLKAHNPHYRSIDWSDEAAAAWESDPELPSREEEISSHGDVDRQLFEMWMATPRVSADAGDGQLALAQTLQEQLTTEPCNGERQSPWFTLLDKLAQLYDKSVYRVARWNR